MEIISVETTVKEEEQKVIFKLKIAKEIMLHSITFKIVCKTNPLVILTLLSIKFF